MRILKPVVAQCFRGGGSTVNRQFRNFSSSDRSIYTNSMKGWQKELLCLSIGLFLAVKCFDHYDIHVEECNAEDRAAKLGKKIRYEQYEYNFLMPNKSTVVYYDDPKPDV